ncbi:MAG TPA: hypothetical protein VK675_03360, partial [Candidatus Paceibacterota bacterium]|nr:hypothetical protein [Candidatus Paceibacterota bacterium]
ATETVVSRAALLTPPLSKVAMSPAPGAVAPLLLPPEDSDQLALVEKEPPADPIQNLVAAWAAVGKTNKVLRKIADTKKSIDLFLSREIKSNNFF